MSISQYPFNGESPRQTLMVGKRKGGRFKAELTRLAGIADRKRFSGDAAGNPSESVNWDHYGNVMAERRRREAEGR